MAILVHTEIDRGYGLKINGFNDTFFKSLYNSSKGKFLKMIFKKIGGPDMKHLKAAKKLV